MKQFFFIALLIFYMLPASSQSKTSEKATITFIAKEGDRAKTYIGKLKSGDITSLKFELQQSRGYSTTPQENYQSQSAAEGYVNRIASSASKKKMKNRRERAENDLIGNYEIKDSLDVEKINERKQKAIAKKYSTEKSPGFLKKIFSPQKGKKTTQLSKYYKVSKRRIRNGQTIKKQAGVVSFVVAYKIMENGFMNTYVNVVNAELIPGSAYYLKYHGSGSNRRYYLEYVPPTKR